MTTSAQCSAAVKIKIIRRRIKNKTGEMTVQLGISVLLPGLEYCVQLSSSSLRILDEVQVLTKVIRSMEKLPNIGQLSMQGLFSLEKR